MLARGVQDTSRGRLSLTLVIQFHVLRTWLGRRQTGIERLDIYNIIQYYTILYHIIPYYTILYNIIQYYTILYNIIQYYTILYNIIQYYTILYKYIIVSYSVI